MSHASADGAVGVLLVEASSLEAAPRRIEPAWIASVDVFQAFVPEKVWPPPSAFATSSGLDVLTPSNDVRPKVYETLSTMSKVGVMTVPDASPEGAYARANPFRKDAAPRWPRSTTQVSPPPDTEVNAEVEPKVEV